MPLSISTPSHLNVILNNYIISMTLSTTTSSHINIIINNNIISYQHYHKDQHSLISIIINIIFNNNVILYQHYSKHHLCLHFITHNINFCFCHLNLVRVSALWSATMATYWSHALKTIPSSFVKPVTVSAKTTSLYLTPSITKPFLPFTSSNHSLTENLKLNSTLPHFCLSSVPKKSFTCRSQAEPVDSGRHTQFSILFLFLYFFLLAWSCVDPSVFLAWLICRKSPRIDCVWDQRAWPWKPCLSSIEL